MSAIDNGVKRFDIINRKLFLMNFDMRVVPPLEDRLEFFENVKLVRKESPDRVRAFANVARSAMLDDRKQDATLISSTLLNCMAGLSRLEKGEIKNSVRFAELMSDGFADQSQNLAEWLKLYSRTLNHVGWYTNRDPGERVYHDLSSTVSQKMIDTVKELGNEAMLTNSLAAMAALQKSASNLASYAKASQWGSSFQVMPSGRDSQGNLTLILNHARLSAQRKINEFLFFRWEASTAVLQHNYISFYLDRAAYAQTRQKIEDILECHDMEEIELRL